MCHSDIAKIINFLLEYPVKTEPYPDFYPDELRFDHYPGQDYVIGFCNEAIEEFTQSYMIAPEPNKDLCRGYAEVFERVKAIRQKKLAEAETKPATPTPTPVPLPSPQKLFEEQVRDALL